MQGGRVYSMLVSLDVWIQAEEGAPAEMAWTMVQEVRGYSLISRAPLWRMRQGEEATVSAVGTLDPRHNTIMMLPQVPAAWVVLGSIVEMEHHIREAVAERGTTAGWAAAGSWCCESRRAYSNCRAQRDTTPIPQASRCVVNAGQGATRPALAPRPVRYARGAPMSRRRVLQRVKHARRATTALQDQPRQRSARLAPIVPTPRRSWRALLATTALQDQPRKWRATFGLFLLAPLLWCLQGCL